MFILVDFEDTISVSLFGSKHKILRSSPHTFSILSNGSKRLNEEPTSIKFMLLTPKLFNSSFSKIIDLVK
tara:strand:- start:376 stop:585 length:210 start_codon:yes stop_codon:yes gene_type:complete